MGAAFDDAIDCPTRDLRLITSAGERGQYRFAIGPKPTLPSSIAAFASLDFVARTDHAGQTVTISRLATEPGRPGRAFKLTEGALVDLLERAATSNPGCLSLTSAAGVPQLAYEGDPAVVASEVLRGHYRELSGQDRHVDGLVVGGAAGSDPYDNRVLEGSK